MSAHVRHGLETKVGRPRHEPPPRCFVTGCRDDGVSTPIRLGPEIELRVIFCDHHRAALAARARSAPAPVPAPAPVAATAPRRAVAGYLTVCPECTGAMPEQHIGTPRRRCPDCTRRLTRARQVSRTQRATRELLTVAPRHCLICDAPIARVPGRHGRDKYCSPECVYEARLRLQRHHRGGLKQPERSLRMLLRSPRVIAPIEIQRTASAT